MERSERNGVPPEAIPEDPDGVPREAPGPAHGREGRAAAEQEAMERSRDASDVERIDGLAAEDVERE